MDEIVSSIPALQQLLNTIDANEATTILLMAGYNGIGWGLIGFMTNWKFEVKNRTKRLKNFLIPASIGFLGTAILMSGVSIIK